MFCRFSGDASCWTHIDVMLITLIGYIIDSYSPWKLCESTLEPQRQSRMTTLYSPSLHHQIQIARHSLTSLVAPNGTRGSWQLKPTRGDPLKQNTDIWTLQRA